MYLQSVILPVSGSETDRPCTGVVLPKMLRPVFDTPLLQFALREAIEAGAKRIVLVARRDTGDMQAFARKSVQEIASLVAGQQPRRAATPHPGMAGDAIDMRVVYQDRALGLGHAVLCASDDLLPGPFGLIEPGVLMFGGSCLRDMALAHTYAADGCCNLVGAVEVDGACEGSRRVLHMASDIGLTRAAHRIATAAELPDDAARLAVAGRYVLSPDIFERLRRAACGPGRDIRLRDALNAMGSLHAFPIAEAQFDCDTDSGLLDAGVALRALRARAEGGASAP